MTPPAKPTRNRPKRLTNEMIEKLKPRPQRYTVRDALVPALELRISPEDRRTWSVRYKHDGVSRRLKIGRWPGMDVPKARAAAGRELHKLDNLVDPAAEKAANRKAAEVAKASGFGLVVDEYVAHLTARKKRTASQDERMLGHAKKKWTGRALASITEDDVADYLAPIAKRAPTSANRHRAALHGLFEFAITERRPKVVQHNPVTRVKAPGLEYAARVKRAGIPAAEKGYTAAEVVRIWANTADLDAPTRCQVRMQLLTASRPGEVVDAVWSEIDLAAGMWVLPHERSKSGRERRIPLTATVVRELKRLTRVDDRDEVFSFYRGAKILARENLRVFKGVSARKKPRHRLRNAATDLMADAGVSFQHASMALGHALPGVASVTVGYSAREWDPFVRGALEALERKVLALVRPPRAKVVAIDSRSRRARRGV